MSAVPAVPMPSAPLPVPPAAARDFDFLFGHWRVQNRRLRRRLEDRHDWDEFEARVECRPVLGGLGNIETFDSHWQGGLRGLAVRLYEPATGLWSIHWASNRDGRLEAPVRGRFEGAVGDFFGPDRHAGREVLSRYRWRRIDGARAVWEQAWSADAGASWETNWVMRFERVAAMPELSA